MTKKFNQISSQITTTRQRQRLSIAALARTTGLTPPTIRSVEQGTASLASLKVVLQALGLSLRIGPSAVSEPGPVIAATRAGRDLSQRRLASEIGVSHPTIIALERRNSGRMTTLLACTDHLGLKVTLAPQEATSRGLVPGKNHPEADKVYTPEDLAKAIIDRLPLDGDVLDPCRGDGAFYRQFPDHVRRHWCEIDQNRDFFARTAPVDWIVSNPPWSEFRAFLRHGMHLSQNVVYLGTLVHFTTRARMRDMRDQGFAMRRIICTPTPTSWPQSGFQTAAVWLQRNYKGQCSIENI